MDHSTQSEVLTKPSAELQASIMRLWGVIRQSGELLVSLREDNRGLAERVAELEENLQRYEERAAQGEDDVRRELAELQTDNRQKKEGIRDLEKQVQSLQEELDAGADMRAALQQAQMRIAELEGDQAENERRIRDTEFLKAELVRRNAEINEHIKESLHFKTQIAELEDKLLVLQKDDSDLGTAREDVEKLKNELNEVRQAYYAEKEANEQRLQEQEPYQADLFSIGEIEAEWRTKAQNLRAEVDTARSRKEAVEQELFERNKEIIQHKKVINQNTFRISELENTYAAMETEKREKEAEALQLRRQLDLLSTRLKEAETQAAGTDTGSMEAQADTEHNRIRKLEEELQHRQDQITRLEALVEQAGAEKPNAQEVSFMSDAERQALSAKVKALLDKVEGLINDAD